jgi:hypothetical protein
MGFMRSLVGLFLILCSVPLITSAFLPHVGSYVGFSEKMYDGAAGFGLFLVGMVIGKLWVINIHKKKSEKA